METPPVPRTKTVSPGLICPSPTSARQAVTPAVVMVAASAWLQPRGAWVKAVAARTEKWAAKPSTPSPGVSAKSPAGPLVDRESLNHALTSDLVGWTVSETREAPLLMHVAPHRLGDIRLLELSGNPFGAVRGHAEISGDSDTYLGILYQRSGSTLCRIGDDRVIVGPGEISVRHSGRPVSFEMPEKFDKLCMIVPIARFESVLYNAETYEGLRLPADSNLATLLGSYLSTLTNSVMTRNDNTPFDAIDVTLELLGAAFRAQRRSSAIAPRDQLFARISGYIETRLKDANLSPKNIAEDIMASRFDIFMRCSADKASPYQGGCEGDVSCVAEPNWTERIPRPP
jgi:hypothetical protein